MLTLLWFALKLAAQLILIAWWGCRLAVWYTARACRTLHARHVQYVRAQKIGATTHDRPAPLGYRPAGRWAAPVSAPPVPAGQCIPQPAHHGPGWPADWQHDYVADITGRTAVDLARAVQQHARTR